MEAELIELPERGITLEIARNGMPTVAMIPSAHRGVGDFERLATDLLAAGHPSIAINVRGIGRSTGSLDGLDLRDVADDIADVLAHVADGPVHVIGHALGQVFARSTASFRPEVVRSVTLLACGGHDRHYRPPPAELLEHFDRCGRSELPTDIRLQSLRALFFADQSDPTVWLDGWWPDADVAQVFGDIDVAAWATAGSVPVLILQPMNDPLCPPEVGRELALMLGRRASYVEVPDCSHAMLPEQPERISRAIIDYLRIQTGEGVGGAGG